MLVRDSAGVASPPLREDNTTGFSRLHRNPTRTAGYLYGDKQLVPGACVFVSNKFINFLNMVGFLVQVLLYSNAIEISSSRVALTFC